MNTCIDPLTYAIEQEEAKMNTATYRHLAEIAENRLDWKEATRCWYMAIAHYPEQEARGQLGQADILRMEDRRTACYITACSKAN